MKRIVQGKEPDSASMVDSLCAAFRDDPGLAWLWPDRADRLMRLPYFFAPIVGGTISNGIALRSASCEAVSLWRQPERITPSAKEMTPWQVEIGQAFSSGAERSKLMGFTLKKHHPTSFRWWYLQFIGVRPEAQGIGIGGEVIRAGLELAAAEHLPVYVEVMNPDNLGYYSHTGFEIVAEFDIPDSGPHVWAMLWGKP